MLEDLQSLVSTLGFPIAVTVYLLWERQHVNKELKDAIEKTLVSAINELKIEIVKLSERIEDLVRSGPS
jgi:hypothetical protein